MKGKTSLKDRVKTAYEITATATSIPADEIQKIEAVIYTMADKFLDSLDLEEIMEGISMTKLGQMLVNKGLAEGDRKARLETAKNLIGLLDEQVIAKTVGLPLETIQELKKEKP